MPFAPKQGEVRGKIWNEPLRGTKIKLCGHGLIFFAHPLELKWTNSRTTYYMVSSVRGQDEPNRGLWLPTRAGKIRSFVARSELPALSRKKIVYPFSVKRAGFFVGFFCEFMELSTPSCKHAKKKTWLVSCHLDLEHLWLVNRFAEARDFGDSNPVALERTVW